MNPKLRDAGALALLALFAAGAIVLVVGGLRALPGRARSEGPAPVAEGPRAARRPAPEPARVRPPERPAGAPEAAGRPAAPEAIPVAREAPPAPEPITFPAVVWPKPEGPTGRVTGLVRDPSGKPIAGAWIDDRDARRAGGAISNDPFGTNDGPVRTGADGRYEIECAAGRWSMVAMLTGYRPGSSPPVEVAPGGVAAAGDIVLVRAGEGTLRARVVTKAGEPYRGPLRIKVGAAEDSEEEASGYERFVADAEGFARPERGLTIGRYSIEAEVEDYASEPVVVEVRDGEVAEATLVIEPESGLRVRVLDDETGAPLAGVSIAVVPPETSAWSSKETGEDGWALIPGISPGSYAVRSHERGFSGIALGERRASFHSSLGIDVTEAMLADGITVRLLRGLEVRGRITNPDGRPVPGGWVFAGETFGSGRIVNVHEGDIEEDGRYRVSGLRPGTFVVVAYHPEWAWAEATVKLDRDNPTAVCDLALGWPGALSGRVVTADGRPAEGARVEAMPATEAGPTAAPEWGDPHGGKRVAATAAADGSYRLSGLKPGDVDVLASLAGYQAAAARAVRIAPGGPAPLDLVLVAGGSISGRVVDAGGAAVTTGGSVYYSPAGAHSSQDVDLDGEGRFAIEGLPDGAFDLSFYVSGYARLEMGGVRSGTRDLVVRVTRAVRLVGRVEVPAGAPLPRVVSYMVMKGTGGGGSAEEVDATGRFVIDDVDPDFTSISLEFPGYPSRSVPRPERVVPGEDIETTVRLERGGTIRGRVVDPAGRPLEDAYASATLVAPGADHRLDPPSATGGRTGEDGAFRIDGAPAGSVRVWVGCNGHEGIEVGPFEVAAGGEVDAGTITLAPETERAAE